MDRKQALQLGNKTYEGKPCKTCNTIIKYTSNWGCVNCAEQKKDNPEVRKRYEQSAKGKAVRQRINKSDAQKERVWLYNNQNKNGQEYYKNNPEKYLGYRVQRYGLTVEQYNQLLIEQKGCCKICGTHTSNLTKALAVDHCHNGGRVRALLCANCNTGLGLFKDNKDVLMKAIDYLEQYK